MQRHAEILAARGYEVSTRSSAFRSLTHGMQLPATDSCRCRFGLKHSIGTLLKTPSLQVIVFFRTGHTGEHKGVT